MRREDVASVMGAATTASAVNATSDVDVVIVTYQSAHHVAECLGHIPAVASIVVVDNASTDDSADIADRAGAHVIRNTENRGFAAAANQGARFGQASLVLLLNPDAVMEPGALEAMVAELVASPTTGVVASRLLAPDGLEQRPSWPFPSARGAWVEALGMHRLQRSSNRPKMQDLDGQFVVGACFLVRRRLFEELNGFDERFWLYGEEADLCRRAADRGWRASVVPEAVAVHVGGASGTQTPEVVFEHFCRGTERFIAVHHGPVALASYRLAALTGALLRLPILAGASVVLGRLRPKATVRWRIIRRSLRVLAAHPTEVDRDEREAPAQDRAIVVLSLEAWDEVWRRNQFFVRELLDGDPSLRVLFVEPPLDYLHALRTRRRPKRVQGLRSIGEIGMKSKAEETTKRPQDADRGCHLWALTPRKFLPRILGPWADRSLERQVLDAASRLGMRQPILWVNSLDFSRLALRCDWPVLYDITDDWTLAEASPRERRRRVERDEAMSRRAGEIVVCSPQLATSKGEAGHATTIVANGVDLDHMQTPQARPPDLPDGPVAVYLGTLHDDRIDVDLIVELATAIPNLHLVLVGPDSLSASSRSRLGVHSNVMLLGSRPYRSVPGYLQHADVIFVPHVVSPFTESLDPIKAYECRAVGTVTVATPVAGFRDLRAPSVCVSRDGFVDALRVVLDRVNATQPTVSTPAACDGVPSPIPSWRDRAGEFRAALDRAGSTRKRWRVVYVDHTAALSGGELALSRMLGALQGDVDATVVLGEDGPFAQRLRAQGIATEVLAMAPEVRDTNRFEVGRRLPLKRVVGAIGYSVRLARRLRQLRPDLVHTNSLKGCLYGGIAARLAGVPVIWHVRDRIADDYLPRSAIHVVKAFGRVVPQAMIFNSEATRDAMDLPRRPSAVIPSPVIYDSVDGADRGLLAASDGNLRIGILGRLARWKGQDVFLRAFAQAFPDGGAVAYVIGSAMFGEDDYERELRKLVAGSGVADRIEFLGFRDDVARVLGELDVLVHASIVPEPFGQVIVEGMAAGLAVIATDAGGPRETITHDVDGLLVPPADVDALVLVLQGLADDPSWRKRLGDAGRLRARDFGPEKVASSVLGVYELVADGGRARSARVSVTNPVGVRS